MTFESALLAAGSTVELMRQILSKEVHVIKHILLKTRPVGISLQFHADRRRHNESENDCALSK